MRLPDLDKILSAMLHTHPGISDLNFSAGHPPQVESFGELKPALIDPPIDILTPFQTERIALALMQGDRRLMYDYLSGGSCDLSYSLSDEARFRVNIFRQRGNLAASMTRAAFFCAEPSYMCSVRGVAFSCRPASRGDGHPDCC